ncbi:MAG: hypothetical protein NT064_04430 [Proteobacteria bacterium]|nr:hypothetical protein [Pseudomonadota bacterium]
MSILVRHVVLAIILAFAVPTLAQELNYQRAVANYRAVIAGQKKLEQLTPQEQKEVIAMARVMRARSASSDDDSSDCRDARERAKSAASELADYARRLKNCAESGDMSDDCSTEFRRVKNAQYDYESAVADVRSNCN